MFVSDDARTPLTVVVIPIDDRLAVQARWAIMLQTPYRPISVPRFSLSQILVLEIMDSLCQLSESTRLDGIFPILETSDGALGNSGLAREQLCGKVFSLVPGFRLNISRQRLFRTPGMPSVC